MRTSVATWLVASLAVATSCHDSKRADSGPGDAPFEAHADGLAELSGTDRGRSLDAADGRWAEESGEERQDGPLSDRPDDHGPVPADMVPSDVLDTAVHDGLDGAAVDLADASPLDLPDAAAPELPDHAVSDMADADWWEGGDSDGGGAEAGAGDMVEPTPPLLGWIPLQVGASPGARAIPTMKESTTRGALVHFGVPGFYSSEVALDGQPFHRVSIPGYASGGATGQPELPVVSGLVEIPFGVIVKLSLFKSNCIILDNYRVAPLQADRIREEVPYDDPAYVEANYEEIPPLAFDAPAYAADKEYPGDLMTVGADDVGVMRGRRLLFLRVHPLQFNPVSQQLRACSDIEVRVGFDHSAQVVAPPTRLENPDFAALLGRVALNFYPPVRRQAEEGGPPATFGCDYLILTPGAFYDAGDPNNPVVRLAAWKQKKGLRTLVVKVEDIAPAPTEADITSYIFEAYHEWGIPPAYVLLVGDSEHLPTHHVTAHASHTPDLIGSDSFYAMVDGADYFPDIYLGRLSVDSVQDCSALVDKILEYEQSPPADDDYYTTWPLISLFEDVRPDPGQKGGPDQGDGREDATFRIIEFAQEAREFLQSDGQTPVPIWAFSGVPGPQQYENGTNLPAELTLAGDPGAGIPGFPWDGDTNGILAEINAGRSVITANLHGGRQAWGDPHMDTGSIDDGSLASPGPLSVYLSYACVTGWFDNETDHPVDTSDKPGNQPTPAGDECLLERLTRLPDAGAAGAIGSTRNSNQDNDYMFLGAFEALFPEFAPAPPGAGNLPDIVHQPIRRMDPLNLFTKVYLAQHNADSASRRRSFEMYHVLGDPEMTIWAAPPGHLLVEHPDCIGSTGTQDFLVRVRAGKTHAPQRLAKVAITGPSSALLAVAYTDSEGRARVRLDWPPEGVVDITVTHLLYRPYMGSIVTTGGGADITALHPEAAIQGEEVFVSAIGFAGDEEVKVTLAGTPVGILEAWAGQLAGLLGVTVPVPFELDWHNLVATGTTSGRCAVDVLRVRSDTTVDLYTYNAHAPSTWHLYRGENPTWNSPNILLEDENGNQVASGNLVAGGNYVVRIRAFNDSDVVAAGAVASLAWADYGAGQPDKVWEDGGLSEPVDIPARDSEYLEVAWSPVKTGHICLRVQLEHDQDVDLTNNSGQENCRVGPTASPHEAELKVWNPTAAPAMVHLELRQLQRAGAGPESLWGSAIVQPDPQLISPGDSRVAKVIVDPALAYGPVADGEQVEFALTAFVHGQMVGGANFAITNGPCPVDGCQAACFPSCDGLECGWDGCDGECGECPQGLLCQDGQCVPPPQQDECGDGKCVGAEDCGSCPADCGACPLCPPGQHDGGLGECLPEGLCEIGFQLAPDGECVLESFHLPFMGLVGNDEGVAAWWADGAGLEPVGLGHSIPAPYDSCYSLWGLYKYAKAYHYIASPDYPAAAAINPDSPGAAHMLTAVSGFPHFRAALDKHGIAFSQVRFSFGYMTLGEDVLGQDWFFANGVETRVYTGGTFTLSVLGQAAVQCTMPPLTLTIDYKTKQSCMDDVISMATAEAQPSDCLDVASGGVVAVQDAADGFIEDLGLAGAIIAVMSSVQPAYDESFVGAGRKGGYFHIMSMSIDGLW